MANSHDQTGVIQVDGAWVTSVKYTAAALGPDAGNVELRFLQGRAEVARAVVPQQKLGELLGEENRGAIERHLANDADKYLAVVSGELRGQRLHFRQVNLSKDQRLAEDAIGSAQTRKVNPPERDLDENKHRIADDGRTARAPAAVPAHIAAKYLVNDNTYHFDDQTVAFTDKGSSLTVHTHNRAIIQDLIAIAQAREWQAVTVSGTKEFRREAWTAATAAGLNVSGYTPTDIERASADRARARRDAASSAETPHPTSLYSEKTAVNASKAESNSSRLGATALTPDQEAAAAIRSAATTREELQLKYPELNRAVFQHLASHDQFADAYVKSGLIRESDRAQVIAQMRERLAGKLERGAVIREPDDKEINTLIRRSVNRVAADIGRPPIDIASRGSVAREDVQVRG